MGHRGQAECHSYGREQELLHLDRQDMASGGSQHCPTFTAPRRNCADRRQNVKPMRAKLAKERWKPVAGFPYEVSNQGQVRSLPRKIAAAGRGERSMKGRLLKGRPNARGHLRVQLCADGVVQDFLVSRLVATYFVPNPRGLPMVRHKDFDRANNAASNLEWCGHADNIERAVEAGRFTALVSPSRAKILDAKTAQAIYEMRESGLPFPDIVTLFDLGTEAVMNVCHDQSWRHDSRPSLARVRASRRP